MGFFNKIFGQPKHTVKESEKSELINPNDIWFSLPTISNEFPRTVPISKQTKFDIHIHEDDYRQNEFLNLNALSLIEHEFIGIKNIWNNHSKKSEQYTLFKNCHVRKVIGAPNLNIDFNKLKTILNCNSTGQPIINGEVISNGFAIKTENTTYFGTLNIDTVSELCVSQWNNSSIDEIRKINKAFHVVFVTWFNCDLIQDD